LDFCGSAFEENSAETVLAQSGRFPEKEPGVLFLRSESLPHSKFSCITEVPSQTSPRKKEPRVDENNVHLAPASGRLLSRPLMGQPVSTFYKLGLEFFQTEKHIQKYQLPQDIPLLTECPGSLPLLQHLPQDCQLPSNILLQGCDLLLLSPSLGRRVFLPYLQQKALGLGWQCSPTLDSFLEFISCEMKDQVSPHCLTMEPKDLYMLASAIPGVMA